MQITRSDTGELSAEVTIRLSPNDYRPRIEEVLRQHKKRVQLHGFRPGMVPLNLVKRMIGKAVFSEEVNDLLAQSLIKFLSDKQIDFLYSPIPKEKPGQKINWYTDQELSFTYELGLAPRFEVKLQNDKITRFTVSLDDSLVKRYTNYLRKRYGNLVTTDISGEDDILYAVASELDVNGQCAEGGITRKIILSLSSLKDNAVKQKLIGLKPGDQINLNTSELAEDAMGIASLLGIDPEKAGKITASRFRLTVNEIKRFEFAELNSDFFNRLPVAKIPVSEEEFNRYVREELAAILSDETEHKLITDMVDYAIEKSKIRLPDDFLKKWLQREIRNGTSESDFDIQYEDFARKTRWQLLVNKTVMENFLGAREEEIHEEAKKNIQDLYARHGYLEVNKEQVNKGAVNLLEDEKNKNKIKTAIHERKVVGWLKERFTVRDKEVTYEEFTKLATGKTEESGFKKFLKHGFWKK